MKDFICKVAKKTLYPIARNLMKVYLTGNLGKVVEDDERLVCYVQKGKCQKNKYDYTISCRGIEGRNKELAKLYQLDKPIYYVLDGLEFENKKVYIFGYDECDVDIRNCKFHWDLSVHVNGHCTFNSTSIHSFGSLSMCAHELQLENMTIQNHLASIGQNLQVILEANQKIYISHSNIGLEGEKTKVLLSGGELHVFDSKIAGDEIECKTNQIVSDLNSLFIASNQISMTSNSFEEVVVSSLNVIYNGKCFSSRKEPILLKEVLDPLRVKRLEFIQCLKKIRDACEKENANKIDEYRSVLDNQDVAKVLRK